MNEKPEVARMPLAARAIFFFCIAATIVVFAGCVAFGLYYIDNQANIKGMAVVLQGIAPPAREAGIKETWKWLDRFSSAAPGCLCAIAAAQQTEHNGFRLLCVGFHKGDGACRLIPERLPQGVRLVSSNPTNIQARQKLVFILHKFAGRKIVNPRTDFKIDTP
jgi:hypothetical protein